MFAHRKPPPNQNTPESHAEQLQLSRAGYRGATRHKTAKAARSAARALLDKLATLNPSVS